MRHERIPCSPRFRRNVYGIYRNFGIFRMRFESSACIFSIKSHDIATGHSTARSPGISPRVRRQYFIINYFYFSHKIILTSLLYTNARLSSIISQPDRCIAVSDAYLCSSSLSRLIDGGIRRRPPIASRFMSNALLLS